RNRTPAASLRRPRSRRILCPPDPLETSMRLNPYLTFNGDCEAAFKLYERVTGGKITAMIRYEGSPIAADAPPEWRNKIIHARLEMGQDTLMGSDASPQHYNKPQGYSITLRVDTPEEAEKAFKGLSDGDDPHAAGQDLLREEIRHAGRQVRHPLDGDLRKPDVSWRLQALRLRPLPRLRTACGGEPERGKPHAQAPLASP